MTVGATVRVVRSPEGWRDHFGRYNVLVDGVERAKLGRGETVDIAVPPGHHTVRVKINWAGSPEWGVDLDEGEIGTFVCRPGGGPLKAFRQIQKDSETYIDLRPADDA